MQRILDILISSIAIIILSPILLLIMLILRFTGEGEVFYKQARVGRNGRIFAIYKFATMVKNSSKIGTGFITTKNDPRVLPVGRVLRKTKLNELPQVFNIFLGDMSIVGPRPQVPKHFELYPQQVRAELKKIRPGLTGIGSIFFRDEEKILENNKHMSYEECYNNVIAPYKGQLELWFVKHQSVGLYLMIILLTAWVVIFPQTNMPSRVFRSLPSPPKELAFK